MPIDRTKYPHNWEEIGLAVKEEADWQCEMCGKQCRRKNEPFDTHKKTLTVAHCDYVEADCRPENLVAAGAPCHLRYDADHHRKNSGIPGTEKNPQNNNFFGRSRNKKNGFF